MANSPQKTPPSTRLTVSSLLSPPEMKRSESFGSSSTAPAFGPAGASYDFNSQSAKAPVTAPFNSQTMAYSASLPTGAAYASPPISPFYTQSQKENMECVDSQDLRDPQLFASSSGTASVAPDEPLFPQSSQESAATPEEVITKHMSSSEYAKLKSKPSREDYELAFTFRSIAIEQAQKDPRGYWERERSYDNYYGKPKGVQKTQTSPLKKLAPAPSSKSRQPKVALPRLPPRTPRVPKARRTPLIEASDLFDESQASVSPRPARQPTNRDDSDYNALPDYCPPLNTLPNGNAKSLKADWKGSALDLSTDPDRGMLHEAELHLASTLRLTCATYLCSKRRVFMKRIETLKVGKEFRKTDAQQACKIDVNKASKLWQSFEKAGWFNPEYFHQYL